MSYGKPFNYSRKLSWILSIQGDNVSNVKIYGTKTQDPTPLSLSTTIIVVEPNITRNSHQTMRITTMNYDGCQNQASAVVVAWTLRRKLRWKIEFEIHNITRLWSTKRVKDKSKFFF